MLFTELFKHVCSTILDLFLEIVIGTIVCHIIFMLTILNRMVEYRVTPLYLPYIQRIKIFVSYCNLGHGPNGCCVRTFVFFQIF